MKGANGEYEKARILELNKASTARPESGVWSRTYAQSLRRPYLGSAQKRERESQ